MTENESKMLSDNLNFPKRLKELRAQKGLSQSELATIIGVHHTHIGRYERGESSPVLRHLQALSKALGVSIDYLIDGTMEDAAIANLEDRELLKMFEDTEKLPKEDKEIIKKFLGAFLNNKKIQQLAS
jgi:transcriptional regulator with XRE-family HTH domain